MLEASDKCAILYRLIDRVVIKQKTIEVRVRINAIPEVINPDFKVGQRGTNITNGDIHTISVAAQLKRTGMETRLIVQGLQASNDRKPDQSLLKLISLAQAFQKLVLDGNGQSITTISKAAGYSPSYFTRVLRLSFLAPEIVTQILQGHQPIELSAKGLILQGQILPRWSEQLAQFDVK